MRQLLRRSSLLLACTYLFALSISVAAACATLPSGKKVDWPSYVTDCAPKVSDAIGTVSAILLGDGTDSTISERGKRELTDLATTEGPKTVACLVQRLVTDWSTPGAAQDPGVSAGAARGRAFLAEVGSTVRLDEDGGGGS